MDERKVSRRDLMSGPLQLLLRFGSDRLQFEWKSERSVNATDAKEGDFSEKLEPPSQAGLY
jgi:hypothetical protein